MARAYMLKDIDPVLWQRVKSKAAAEGASAKAVILRLLTEWVARPANVTKTGTGR